MKLLLIYFLIINIIAFAYYGIDKYKAKHDKWRIKEKTLLLLAFFGGCLGAFLGMKIFHHKTQHKQFTIIVPICIILWIVIFYFAYKGSINLG